jgi:hypothetical protein
MAACGARVRSVDFGIDQTIERHRSAPRENHAEQNPDQIAEPERWVRSRRKRRRESHHGRQACKG